MINSKRGVVWLTWPIFCTRNCGLSKTLPRHAINWDQQCRRRRTAVSLIYGAADTLRLKLHRFDFLCVCCKLACIIRRHNKSTKWSSDLTVYVCANNRQVAVCVAMCFKYRSQRCCLVISLGVQCGIGDFAWGSVARSIGVSRYTCVSPNWTKFRWSTIIFGDTLISLK